MAIHEQVSVALTVLALSNSHKHSVFCFCIQQLVPCVWLLADVSDVQARTDVSMSDYSRSSRGTLKMCWCSAKYSDVCDACHV